MPSSVGLRLFGFYYFVFIYLSFYDAYLQEEYEREKIQWTFIEFPDNKDCIELIDRKPNGIIPTLDEQVCRCILHTSSYVRLCVYYGTLSVHLLFS